MRTNTTLAAIVFAAVITSSAHAQIGVPGITLPAQATAASSFSQAALSPSKPGVVTLRDAAQENSEVAKTASASAAQGAKEPIRPPEVQNPIATAAMTAQAPAPMLTQPATVTPLPSQFGALPLGPRPKPDVMLMRISTRDGIQRATLQVKGSTRAGLTVGDKVLKMVLSEFRDDGVCLDVSLHKPKCATFVPFSYE